MDFKRRTLPIEVSSWMDKDLTLRRISANSRLLTNDTRQNIVLSRYFFSNLLNLSYARYRTMGEHDCEKKMFLKNQQRKTETSMPGLRPYIDPLIYGMNRPTTSRRQSRKQSDRSSISPSIPSLFSRSNTKSDLRFDRRRQSSIRQIKTAQIMKSEPEITIIENSSTVPNQRPRTSRQMSRETFNRLTQPKGTRFKSAPSHPRRLNPTESTETIEEVLAKIDDISEIASSPTQDILLGKRKSAVNDNRFHELMDAFSRIHVSETSKSHTRKSIVEANPSLQDDEGLWKMEHPSVSSRKAELEHHRQMLAGKLFSKLDIFLIDVRA